MCASLVVVTAFNDFNLKFLAFVKKIVSFGVSYGAVDSALNEGDILLYACNQAFNILALGVFIGGTRAFENGLILAKRCDICLVYIDHGADEGHFRPVHIGYGCKGGEPALKKHGEEKRFDKVVGVMT